MIPLEKKGPTLKGVGPFSQLLTMDGISISGPIKDSQLEIIEKGAIVLKGSEIFEIGTFSDLKKKYTEINFIDTKEPSVCLPGFIDVHTHICWGGSKRKNN